MAGASDALTCGSAARANGPVAAGLGGTGAAAPKPDMLQASIAIGNIQHVVRSIDMFRTLAA